MSERVLRQNIKFNKTNIWQAKIFYSFFVMEIFTSFCFRGTTNKQKKASRQIQRRSEKSQIIIIRWQHYILKDSRRASLDSLM
jgi:hypothetical protein